MRRLMPYLGLFLVGFLLWKGFEASHFATSMGILAGVVTLVVLVHIQEREFRRWLLRVMTMEEIEARSGTSTPNTMQIICMLRDVAWELRGPVNLGNAIRRMMLSLGIYGVDNEILTTLNGNSYHGPTLVGYFKNIMVSVGPLGGGFRASIVRNPTSPGPIDEITFIEATLEQLEKALREHLCGSSPGPSE